MKALTVCQPYAWALIHGPKRIENRTWYTHYRGALLIHAGKSKKWWPDEPVLADGTPIPPPTELAWGAIIGSVTLHDCVPISYFGPHRSPFACGPFCWRTEHPIAFKPVPFRGAMGFFEVPHEVASRLIVVPKQALGPG